MSRDLRKKVVNYGGTPVYMCPLSLKRGRNLKITRYNFAFI